MTRTAVLSMILLSACVAGEPDPAPAAPPPVAATVTEALATPADLHTQMLEVRDHGCDALGRAPLALSAHWSDAARSPDEAGNARVFYGACATATIDWTTCKAERGMTLCEGGHWSTLCESDADCPTLTRCSWEDAAGDRPRAHTGDFGRCERGCKVDAECGEFGLRCDSAIGLCGSPPVEHDDDDLEAAPAGFLERVRRLLHRG